VLGLDESAELALEEGVGRRNLTQAASDDGGLGAAVGQLGEVGGYGSPSWPSREYFEAVVKLSQATPAALSTV